MRCTNEQTVALRTAVTWLQERNLPAVAAYCPVTATRDYEARLPRRNLSCHQDGLLNLQSELFRQHDSYVSHLKDPQHEEKSRDSQILEG